MNSVLSELEEDKGIPRAKVIEAIEAALATAYKKEYAKKGQVIRAHLDMDTGAAKFEQVKTVVDETTVRFDENDETTDDENNESELDAEGNPVMPLPRYNPEQHILLADARLIKRDVKVGDELVFPLETKGDCGRIAAQTAKQVIIQKIREAEKVSVVAEYGARQGEIVSGTVQRMERGNLYIDLGRATGILPFEEQIPGERYRQGERIRALLFKVDENARGSFLKLSRSHPRFLVKLFEAEVPEAANATVEIKAVVREPGSRAKVAVVSHDDHIDPVGALVGQRGVRVAVVTSELGGEKIDIVEWSANPAEFVQEALKPAEILDITLDEDDGRAIVTVAEDQQSLAIGRGGQNVRLAARLTNWKIDIRSAGGTAPAPAAEVVEETAVEDAPSNEEVKATEVAVEAESETEKAAE